MIQSVVLVFGLSVALFGLGSELLLGVVRAEAHQATAIPSSTPVISGLIVVTPFLNITQDPGDDWLGDGIAATVTTDLNAAGLEVIRGGSASELDAVLGSDNEPLVAVGRSRGAVWVLGGGFQRLGDRLRITVRLVEVATGMVREAVTVDGVFDDLFALQDEVAIRLIANLQLSGFDARPTPQNLIGDVVNDVPEVVSGLEISEVEVETETLTARPDEIEFEASIDVGILEGRPAFRPERTTDPPDIDGRLDDAVWRDGTVLSEFVQLTPLDGAPATEQTDIYIAYDNQNIYVGAHVHYSNLTDIRANRSDRDQTFSDDTIALYFDPFLDQQRAYIFSVNGYGVQGDAILDSSSRGGMMGSGGGGGGGGGMSSATRGGSGGGGGSRRGGMGASLAAALGGAPMGDSSWDALFESAGRLVEDGWTAEMAIPFKSLRYPSRASGEFHRWGFQVVRSIPSKSETDVWAPMSRDIAGFLPQMGLLDGMTDLSTSRNIEVLPTFTAIKYGSLDTSTGTFVDGAPNPEGGINLKYGVTPNLTMDFTYNPDFSQIESDIPQIEVNQRFPLFYPELRPFFLEGQEIFQVPGQVNLLHTRTIVDPLYGAKLTGKVGRTTVGVLVANDEAAGKFDDSSDPGFGKLAQVVVGRARYDLYSESYIGVIATDREFLDSYSRVAGVDARFRLGQTSSVSFQYAGSDHRDETGAQNSGPAMHLSFNNSGRNLSYSASIDTVDPGFRTDTGFVRRVDTRVAQADVSYQWWPQNWLINWGPRVSYSRNYDFVGRLQDEQASAGVMGVTSNNLVWIGMLNRDMERFEDIEFSKTNFYVGAGLSSSRRFSVGGFITRGDQIRYDDDPFLGNGVTGTLMVTLRPMSRLNADMSFITSRLHDPMANEQVFDVKIFRTLSTFQITNRLLFRNIMEYNTFSGALAANLLFTYRVNSGTVFFVGYDDHYQQGRRIDQQLFPTLRFEQTNRAFFTKLSYLFRF